MKNIYTPQAKIFQKELLAIDICSQMKADYLEVQGYYSMSLFTFKAIAENKAEVLKQAIQAQKA
tara:strand:- start:258 stop:449 length:192 start_codon:yes stop_codon:yes gene_type:complete